MNCSDTAGCAASIVEQRHTWRVLCEAFARISERDATLAVALPCRPQGGEWHDHAPVVIAKSIIPMFMEAMQHKHDHGIVWGRTTPGWTDRQPDAIHEYEISGIGEVKATNQPVSQTTAEGQGALYAGKIDMHIKCV